MAVTAPLLYRRRTRLGWVLTATVTGFLAALLLWPAADLSGNLARSLVLLGLAAGYGWVAAGAAQLAVGRRAYVAVHGDSLVVVHDGLLGEPLVVHRDDVAEVEVDPRPIDERSTAAALRRGGVAPPTFLDPDLAVVSPSPSTHSDYGTAVVPNVVVRFARPLAMAPPTLSVRFLLRLVQGRHGQYRGPKPGQTDDAVRLVVDDVGEIAAPLSTWERIDVEPRDERYLVAVTAEHRHRHRRQQLLMAAGVAAIAALALALEILSRA